MVLPSPAADPWVQLADLQAKAQGDEAFRAIYSAALRDFHEAGWTYRQLGKACGVSHEYVRLAILDIPEDVTSSGLTAPPRPKSLSAIPLRDLDAQVAAMLKTRLSEAVQADPAERTGSGVKPAVANYFAALQRAVGAGWDAHSIAHSLGSHPKAVFKFVAQQERYGEGTSPRLPDAPHRDAPTLWRASRPSLPLVVVPDSDVRQMHDLEKSAYGDAPAATALRLYESLLGAWYLLGANREELERATGQQWETIRKRLVRAGYMSGKPRSSAKPIT
ncbi:hypothetical protein [Arthrobacter sp. UYCo732]|uniref:hypothetical protein n=1 Tax=Arthrobacter sp. UYCo732 TaxID=3156336 RepID=UPI003392FEB6